MTKDTHHHITAAYRNAEMDLCPLKAIGRKLFHQSTGVKFIWDISLYEKIAFIQFVLWKNSKQIYKAGRIPVITTTGNNS